MVFTTVCYTSFLLNHTPNTNSTSNDYTKLFICTARWDRIRSNDTARAAFPVIRRLSSPCSARIGPCCPGLPFFPSPPVSKYLPAHGPGKPVTVQEGLFQPPPHSATLAFPPFFAWREPGRVWERKQGGQGEGGEREERGSTKMMKPVFGMGCLRRQAGPRGCSVWPWHRLSFWSSCVH